MESIILDEWAELPGAEYQPLLDFESEILDEGKFADVDFLTKEIKRGFLDYVRQGIMLYTIRRFRLYKDKFKDFKTYCEQGLGRQYFYCKQIIKAADICLSLIKSGFKVLPNCVAQAIPLLKYAGVDKYGDSPLVSKWQEVVDTVPKERISAVTIAETIDENPEPRLQQVRIKKDTYAILLIKALEAGLSFSELLDIIAEEYNPQHIEEPTIHTSEQQEILELTSEQQEILDEREVILDKLDVQFQQSAIVEDFGEIQGFTIRKPDQKPSNGFTIRKSHKKPSKCHQKAILSAKAGKESDSS